MTQNCIDCINDACDMFGHKCELYTHCSNRKLKSPPDALVLLTSWVKHWERVHSSGDYVSVSAFNTMVQRLREDPESVLQQSRDEGWG